MATIASILSGPGEPWGENHDMVTYEVQTSDGQQGVVFRKTSSAPLAPGAEVVPNGSTKQGKTKFKIATQYAGTSGVASGDDKMRSKEQCMRGEALQAAANIASDESQVFALASRFYSWIDGSVTTAADSPTPQSVASQAPQPEIDF